ncbi:MAG: DedA family protein [Myxococcales bacterium]|nr:DedA family protein [Myxococcales bacterium]
MEQWIQELVQTSPNMAYVAVFGVLLACGLGVPMPEDITLIAGGYTVYIADISHAGSPKLIPMIIVGMIGVLTGDTLLFLAGRWLGPKATKIWPFRRLFSPKRLEKTRSFFTKYGGWTAFFARFAAGFRAPTYLLAGSMGMKWRTFVLCDGSAALISVPLLVWLAWHFGAEINKVKEWLAKSKYALAGVFIVLAVYILVRVILGRIRRKNEAAANAELLEKLENERTGADPAPPAAATAAAEQDN